jgi:hypothetical protein
MERKGLKDPRSHVMALKHGTKVATCRPKKKLIEW